MGFIGMIKHKTHAGFTFVHVCCVVAFNSLVGGTMGFSILISAEVFKHHPNVWYLDGTFGVLIGLIILGYGVK